MVEIIEILRLEHRNIEKLLRVMEQELSVFDRGERPDYEVFGAVIEFFTKSIPTAVIIQRRTSFTGNLRRVILVEQRQLLTLKLSIGKGHVRDFIDNERKHVALEDEVIFPAIVDTLQPGDWADIALTLADRYGPPSQADLKISSVYFAETYSSLKRPQLRGGYSLYPLSNITTAHVRFLSFPGARAIFQCFDASDARSR